MKYAYNNKYLKGRGAQVNTHNKFSRFSYVKDNIESLDEEVYQQLPTKVIEVWPKTIVTISDSPDIGFRQSINPYQGCEHGCLYCYARNSHEYWGFSAGLEFERNILVKKEAARLLKKHFNKKGYIPSPIMLSGNTDCYQPVEKDLKITRSLLEVFLQYKHPVSIITKNTLLMRDMDLLKELAQLKLVHTTITINSLNEELRRKMEPRTATAKNRLKLIETLASENIPVQLMAAPIIPGLNSSEIPELIKSAADAGAKSAIYTLLRLNGVIGEVFKDWIIKTYPDRAGKVLTMIASCHQGNLNDSRWGTRMRGDGKIAESIHQLIKISINRSMPQMSMPSLSTEHFTPDTGFQKKLF